MRLDLDQIRPHGLDTTLRLSDVDLNDYDGIHVAGGVGAAVDLFPNDDVAAALEHFWAAGKVVGAICHGAISLGNIPLRLRGKRVTGYSLKEDLALEGRFGKGFVPNYPQPTLESTGAIYSAAGEHVVHVVVDGKLVTGQNQESASEYALAFHHLLNGTSPVVVVSPNSAPA